MKKVIKYTLLTFLSICSVKIYGQWSIIFDDSDHEPFVDITFVSKDTGFALTSSKIYRTIDKGATWNIVNESTESPFYRSISFGSSQVGYVVGDLANSALITIDGGTNWESIDGMGSNLQNILDVFCVSENRCFAAKYFVLGSVLSTSDGFLNYDYSNFGCANFNSIYFIDLDTGYACGWDCGGMILKKTINGGEDWENISIDGSDFGNKIYFPTSLVGFCITDNGSNFYRTADYGGTWNSVPYPYENGWLINLDFISEDTGYVTGEKHLDIIDPIDSIWGSISKTTNSGLFWTEESIDATVGSVLTIHCLDDKNCFAGTNDGKILSNQFSDTSTYIQEDTYLQDISVFPNPAENYIILKCPHSELINSITTYNLLGQIVNLKFGPDLLANTDELTPSYYITEVLINNNLVRIDWIKQ